MSGLIRGRLSVVVAAAGYGKTTAVEQWRHGNGEERVLVVDDVHRTGLPATLGDVTRLVLISRSPVSVAPLLRYDLGAPVEIGPARLALSPRRVARLLATQYGITDPVRAAAVHELTAGWPALAQLAGARLASGVPPKANLLAAPGSPLHDYICGEVLGELPEQAADLLAHIAEVDLMSTDLATALGQEPAVAALALLARLGLLLPPHPGRQLHSLVPVVAAAVRANTPLSAARRRVTVAMAAEWHVDHGRPGDALRLALASADQLRAVRLLIDHGAALLAGGDADNVIAAAELQPADQRTATIDILYADALQATGNTPAAIAVYARLAGDRTELPPELAWRYGAAVYNWGDPQDALAVLRRGRLDGGGPDEALLLAWTAAAQWLAGDEAACAEYAARAYEVAVATDDERALAAGHVALALCAHLTGDPVGLRAHYSRALELAEACGDTVQILRIRINLAAGLEQESRLIEALAVLRPAIELAERVGHATSLALALSNEGALLHRLGRLDDSVASYQQAVQVYQRMHSRKVAYPLTGLGDVHRLRGQSAQAKAAYAEALRTAVEDGNNRQGVVPALAGLARVLAEPDPAEAAELAERAVKHACGHWVTTALVARAWVSVQAGRPEDGRRDAEAAADAAAVHRDRTGLAQALEVRAAASGDPAQARHALVEALDIWTGSQAELEADRIRIALGRLSGASNDQRLLARLAESRLAAAGVPVPPLARAPEAPAPVEVRVLGAFTVLVNDRPLPPAAWQSRKARDMLRALIARRGRPVSRDELAELLWGPVTPADQDKVGHRLSVALSTLRTVLDPDRRAPADHFVVASQHNIAVDLGHLTVDVEDLFAQARYGFRLRERGEFADAWDVLTAADRAYPAEVFADDPYPSWAQPLREEARATHLRILRVLVELGQRAGEVDDVVHYLSRVLSVDPFDEQAHLDLVTALSEAGRHGEASRAYRRYAEAMHEIGVPVRDIPGLIRR